MQRVDLTDFQFNVALSGTLAAAFYHFKKVVETGNLKINIDHDANAIKEAYLNDKQIRYFTDRVTMAILELKSLDEMEKESTNA